MSLLGGNLFKLMGRVDETFTSLTGQSISFMNVEGEWVLPLNIDMFTGFCKYVIDSEKGNTRCNECNKAFDEIYKDGKNIIKCHMGLTTISVPIIINNNYKYLITMGQILQEGDEKEFYNNLLENSVELNLDFDTLLKEAGKIKVLSNSELLARVQFLLILSEYISIAESEIENKNKYLTEFKNKVELENRLKDMEFKFLQSQINPHFLFNTLNLVARTANNEGASKTVGLVYDLSDLLRWGFKSKDSMCRLKEEFDSTKRYLDIQRIRFNERLDFEIDLDSDLENEMIPVLSIQPLVENIVIHGFENGDKEIYIKVKARKNGDQVKITINDNGCGMSEETLKMLQEHKNIGTGIHNVEKRLNLYFGESLRFNIESTIGVGTNIEITWQSN